MNLDLENIARAERERRLAAANRDHPTCVGGWTAAKWRAHGLAIYAGTELIGHVGGTLGSGPRQREQEANARLMAAAPALLTALEACASDEPGAKEAAQELIDKLRST